MLAARGQWVLIGGMNPSLNLFLIGPTGAGKTTLGAWLAPRLSLPCVDLDRVIEAQAGQPVREIFAHEGEAGFRARESAALLEHSTHAGVLLVCGGGIVTHADNRAWLRQRGFVLWLRVSAPTRARRLADDATRPLLAGDDLLARLQQLDAARAIWYRECADAVLDETHDENIDALGARALALLHVHWRRGAAITGAPA